LVIESITKYAAPKDFVLEYDKYKDYNSDLIFKEIEKNYEFYINEYFRNLKNPNAYFNIQKLAEKDQNIRNISNDIQKRITLDKKHTWKLYSIFNKKMIEVDFETTNSLIELTKKYGYEDRAWLILWHQRGQDYKDGNTKFWKYFKPLIEKEIQNGKLHESFFGQFDDENELRNGKQIYGYYLFQVQMCPIVDIKNVDYRRKQIGLPPLLYDNLIYGMSLPQEYSLTEKELYEELLSRIK
jgi:hypothetical protein